MNINNPHFYNRVYEDDSLLILDKAQGLATAPGRKRQLCEYVFSDYPALALVKGYKSGEGGLLNRLDNETGGLVLFAKTNEAFRYYSLQMKAQKVIKYYTAVVRGSPKAQSGIITFPLAHHHKSKKKMAVADGTARYRSKPQEAVTRWKLLRLHKQGAVLEIMIKKGVRHQIRVHLAAAGMPIVGDKLYNKEDSAFAFHLLYATGVELKTDQGKKLVLKINAPFLNTEPA
ncbi:MAG: RNA pseudouridine synthase [Spirochaetales bacterium]|nr:RNA pseudouridine synthase [Spirochaetales bacterium]